MLKLGRVSPREGPFTNRVPDHDFDAPVPRLRDAVRRSTPADCLIWLVDDLNARLIPNFERAGRTVLVRHQDNERLGTSARAEDEQ